MDCNKTKVIDFNNVNINIGEFVRIVGIYNKLNSTDNVVLVRNLALKGSILNNFYVQLIREYNTIYLHSEIFTIVIRDDDVVSIITEPGKEPEFQIPITKIIFDGSYENIDSSGEYDVIFSSPRIDGVLIWEDSRGNVGMAVADRNNVVNNVPRYDWGGCTLDVARSKIIVEIY